MAQSVGKLVAILGLDAAEYTRGLTKAEADAKRFSENTRNAIKDVAGALAGLELGREFVSAAKEIVSEASALNDLSSATGSSVEALSRLNNQSKIAGADFATLEKAVLKLSAGMSGVESKGTKTNETLALLGVTAKDPVEALQQVAVKLATYEDGINKVGIAQRLFGQEGRAFLKTLQDIAELQDVGATVSARQAAEAEALGKAINRLSVEAVGFKNAILNDVVPALLTLISTFNDARNAAGSFGQGLEATFSLLARSGDDVGQLAKVRAEIDQTRKSLSRGFGPFKGLADLNNLINGEKFANLLAQEKVLENRIASRLDKAEQSFNAGKKPQAPPPPGADVKTGRAVRAERDEAQALLETLLKTQQATLDLTTEETARAASFAAFA